MPKMCDWDRKALRLAGERKQSFLLVDMGSFLEIGYRCCNDTEYVTGHSLQPPDSIFQPPNQSIAIQVWTVVNIATLRVFSKISWKKTHSLILNCSSGSLQFYWSVRPFWKHSTSHKIQSSWKLTFPNQSSPSAIFVPSNPFLLTSTYPARLYTIPFPTSKPLSNKAALAIQGSCPKQ